MPRRTTGGAGKRMPMNMRTTAELRRKIDKAAAKSGRSLVQEVEHRVEQSFSQAETNGVISTLVEAFDDINKELKRIDIVLNTILKAQDRIVERIISLDGDSRHTNLALRRMMQNGTQPHG